VPLFARDQLLGLVMTGWQDGGVGHSASAPDELAEVARHVGPFLDFLMAAGARDLIGRISNGVAHDAQGLLTPMSALIQLVEAGGESNLEKAARMLPVARESLKTLEELLQHARRAPGIQQPRTKAVRVDEIVGRVVQGMRSELDGKRISLVADLQPITVSADETLILRLIRNLLANSGNAVLPGGWIRVTLASSAGEPESKFVARISITDSGPGFEAEILEKIFSPVMAIVGAGSGQTGIGLTVCRWIVYLHHGELKIFSQPGRPTTVQIDLPGWG
jgi:two-component system nitrogen regulation sensor histidine kinase GlnL